MRVINEHMTHKTSANVKCKLVYLFE